MKKLEIYDPPQCCSTGVCGPEVNPALVELAAMLNRLSRQGVKVRRFNLNQQPMAFADNAEVKALLESGGVEALPAFFEDGTLVFNGRYPDQAEYTRWLDATA